IAREDHGAFGGSVFRRGRVGRGCVGQGFSVLVAGLFDRGACVAWRGDHGAFGGPVPAVYISRSSLGMPLLPVTIFQLINDRTASVTLGDVRSQRRRFALVSRRVEEQSQMHLIRTRSFWAHW